MTPFVSPQLNHVVMKVTVHPGLSVVDLCFPSTRIKSVPFALKYTHLYDHLFGHSPCNADTVLAHTLSGNFSSVVLNLSSTAVPLARCGVWVG